MKRIKRIASLILAMAMVFAMSATVFARSDLTTSDNPNFSAEGSGDTQTPGGDEQGDTPGGTNTTPALTQTGNYKIYQIFKADVDENGVVSNIKWGKNGTGIQNEDVGEEVVNDLEAVYASGDNDGNNHTVNDLAQLEVIKKYANLDGNPYDSGPGTTYSVESGYYLISGTVTYSGGEKYTSDTLYVVRVSGTTLEFSPKVGVPTVDKEIVTDKGNVEASAASIGDEVSYKITGTMPSNIDNYKTYYYLFTDTLEKGLTYEKDSIEVKVNNQRVTSGFSFSVTNNEGTDNTMTVEFENLKSLSKVVGDITADTEVVLTYKAVLNVYAVSAGEGNKNSVTLKYSNDPNGSGTGSTTPTGVTPKQEAVVYTTEVTITKTNQKGAFLPGVEFTLEGNDVNVVLVTETKFEENATGEYWKLKNGTYTKDDPKEHDASAYESTETKYAKTESAVAKGAGKGENGAKTDVVGIVDENGTVTFRGLGEGTYKIIETKALPGYNIAPPITFTLSFNSESKKFSSDNDEVKVGADNMFDTAIVNQSGALLPSTGGIGTTIFYVVGGLLVAGAGILLVTKKRMNTR